MRTLTPRASGCKVPSFTKFDFFQASQHHGSQHVAQPSDFIRNANWVAVKLLVASIRSFSCWQYKLIAIHLLGQRGTSAKICSAACKISPAALTTCTVSNGTTEFGNGLGSRSGRLINFLHLTATLHPPGPLHPKHLLQILPANPAGETSCCKQAEQTGSQKWKPMVPGKLWPFHLRLQSLPQLSSSTCTCKITWKGGL